MMSRYYNFSSNNFIMATTYSSKKKNDYENFISTLSDLGLDKKKVACLNQTHSDNVQIISSPGIYDNCDGIISKIKNQLTLVVKTADCLPIFMYDNIKGIYGIIHAGWKGVYKKIHLKALNDFLDLNSNSKDIDIFIGPSIRECCLEIKEDLIKLFDNKFIIRKDDKCYLNLIELITFDFNKLGIENIKIDKTCTYENNECFSYRRNKSELRMYSLISPLLCNK